MTLSDDLRHWINLSHAQAWAASVSSPAVYKTPDEPGLVAALLGSDIQNGLEAELKKALGPTANVQVDSVFTHKTPLVKPNGKTPVEIGDLLLIRQHFVTGPTPSAQGMAVLLQAKKNSKPSSGNVSSGKENIQFELYRDWPTFHGETRLARTPDAHPKAKPWDFKEPHRKNKFGQYLAIFDQAAHDFTPPTTLGAATTAFTASSYPPTAWSSGLVMPPPGPLEVNCPDDFAHTLAEFLRGNVGEPFAPGSIGGTDHWSRFINTMLGEAAKTSYSFVSRRTNITTATPRGARICTLMAMEPLVKLAIIQEIQSYLPRHDGSGLPNFMDEPHFFYNASRRPGFIYDLREMSETLRQLIGAIDTPPNNPEDSVRRADDNDGHVPILSIATSGPQPLWDMPRPRQE